MSRKLLQTFSATKQKLHHIFSKLSTTGRRNELCQQRPGGLLDLPVEIILIIQNFLPLASAVSLALTHRCLLHIRGDKLLRSINVPANADQRKDFLLSLQKDLPKWQFCHPCSVFHPLQKKVTTCTIWNYHEPDCVHFSGQVYFMPYFQISYHHAQLVMNRYRFGTLHKDGLKSLAYKHNSSCFGHIVVTPSIKDGGLAIYMTTTKRLMGCWDGNEIGYLLPQVCPHPDRWAECGARIHCQLNHDAKQSCIDWARWQSCPKCHTLFYVEVQRINTAEIVVQLDTRKWLGPCETPMDPCWSRHCFPAFKGQKDGPSADT